jgi:hypothetical protein
MEGCRKSEEGREGWRGAERVRKGGKDGGVQKE